METVPVPEQVIEVSSVSSEFSTCTTAVKSQRRWSPDTTIHHGNQDPVLYTSPIRNASAYKSTYFQEKRNSLMTRFTGGLVLNLKSVLIPSDGRKGSLEAAENERRTESSDLFLCAEATLELR